MPHEPSEDALNQPNGPKGSPLCPPLTAWDPLPRPPPPHRSCRTPNRSLGLIELLRSPQLPIKASEDQSNVAFDPMRHLTPPPLKPWDPVVLPLTPCDPLGLPLDPLGPCRPTP